MAATIEEALYTKITGTAAISALISTRCYPATLPQDPTYPAVMYRRVDTERPYAHDGAGDLGIARYQFSCYGLTYSAARGLANALRLALAGFRGNVTVGGDTVHVDAILFIDEYDDYEDDSGARIIPIDFRVIHKEDN